MLAIHHVCLKRIKCLCMLHAACRLCLCNKKSWINILVGAREYRRTGDSCVVGIEVDCGWRVRLRNALLWECALSTVATVYAAPHRATTVIARHGIRDPLAVVRTSPIIR